MTAKQLDLNDFAVREKIQITLKTLIGFTKRFFKEYIKFGDIPLLDDGMCRATDLDLQFFETDDSNTVKIVQVSNTKKEIVKPDNTKQFYRNLMDIVKDPKSNHFGIVYFLYTYDSKGKFQILYVGICRKYGSESTCPKCYHRDNHYYFSPDVKNVTVKSNIETHESTLTCPKCKEQFDSNITVNRNLTIPRCEGRIGYDSERHAGQIFEALLHATDKLKEYLGTKKGGKLTRSKQNSIKTKEKWVKYLFEHPLAYPPKLRIPLFFSAIAWDEKKIPELGNITMTLIKLEKILQDFGKYLNPNMFNSEHIKLSRKDKPVLLYQKMVRLIEKIYGNLDTLSDEFNCNTERESIKEINGISRKNKQLSKLNKKWSNVERKNEKEVINILAGV